MIAALWIFGFLIAGQFGVIYFLYHMIKENENDISGLDKEVVRTRRDLGGRLNAGLNALANETPRVKITKDREAIITTPEGEKIHEWKLPKK